jgi:hypothetical protein
MTEPQRRKVCLRQVGSLLHSEKRAHREIVAAVTAGRSSAVPLRRQRRGDSGNYRTEESDELVFYFGTGFENFLGGKSRTGDAGGHVGDTGDAEDANAGVAGGEDFRNGGHADEIGA